VNFLTSNCPRPLGSPLRYHSQAVPQPRPLASAKHPTGHCRTLEPYDSVSRILSEGKSVDFPQPAHAIANHLFAAWAAVPPIPLWGWRQLSRWLQQHGPPGASSGKFTVRPFGGD
jgi:hypothetical protein